MELRKQGTLLYSGTQRWGRKTLLGTLLPFREILFSGVLRTINMCMKNSYYIFSHPVWYMNTYHVKNMIFFISRIITIYKVFRDIFSGIITIYEGFYSDVFFELNIMAGFCRCKLSRIFWLDIKNRILFCFCFCFLMFFLHK